MPAYLPDDVETRPQRPGQGSILGMGWRAALAELRVLVEAAPAMRDHRSQEDGLQSAQLASIAADT